MAFCVACWYSSQGMRGARAGGRESWFVDIRLNGQGMQKLENMERKLANISHFTRIVRKGEHRVNEYRCVKNDKYYGAFNRFEARDQEL